MPWYVWMLLSLQFITFALLIGMLKRPKQIETDSVGGREDKILRLYEQIEEMLDSFEEYVGEVHTQLEDKRTELIELNRQAQVVYLQALDSAKPAPVAMPVYVPMPEPENILAAQPAQPVQPQPQPVQEAAAGRGKPKKETVNGSAKRSRLSEKDKEALGRFATKPQKVRFLMSRGMSIDEVARELDIGKGEVLLITDLDKS
jgi:hypothetical protein